MPELSSYSSCKTTLAPNNSPLNHCSTVFHLCGLATWGTNLKGFSWDYFNLFNLSTSFSGNSNVFLYSTRSIKTPGL